ncbi:MAG TPA: hypothetical protein VEY51_06930 [Chondromyces sp.]|nr:hypothetical protein [Chondromyces sp.]
MSFSNGELAFLVGTYMDYNGKKGWSHLSSKDGLCSKANIEGGMFV